MINILIVYSELYKPYDLIDTVLKMNIKRLHLVQLRSSRVRQKLEKDDRYLFKSKQKSPITVLEDPEYEDEYLWIEKEDIIEDDSDKLIYNIIYVDNIDLKLDIENLEIEYPELYSVKVINILPKPRGLFINSSYSVLMMAKCSSEVLVKLEERVISDMKLYYTNLRKTLHSIKNFNFSPNSSYIIVSCIDSAADVKSISKSVRAILTNSNRISTFNKKSLDSYIKEIDDFYYGLGLGYKLNKIKKKRMV